MSVNNQPSGKLLPMCVSERDVRVINPQRVLKPNPTTSTSTPESQIPIALPVYLNK